MKDDSITSHLYFNSFLGLFEMQILFKMLGFVLAQSASVIYCSFIVILSFVLALLKNIVNAVIFLPLIF